VRIRNYLSSDYLTEFNQRVLSSTISNKCILVRNAGWASPMPFSLVTGLNVAEYIQSQKNGFTYSNIVDNLLLPYFSKMLNLPISKLSLDDTFNYIEAPSVTLRSLSSQGEGMDLHIGYELNSFYKESFYDRVRNEIDLSFGQLGFFITLQKPKQGGVLRIYESWPKSNSCFEIFPEEGDMVIIFESGFWHEVTKPDGDKDRLSLGGFLAYSHNKDNLYCWS